MSEESFAVGIAKSFTMSFVEAAGGQAGEEITTSVLGALGLGSDDSQAAWDKVSGELSAIESQLSTIASELGSITSELDKIEHELEEEAKAQTIRDNFSAWQDADDKIGYKEINNLWSFAQSADEPFETWKGDVVDGTTGALAQMHGIHTVCMNAQNSPIDLYSKYLVSIIEARWPQEAPWGPPAQFRAYVETLLCRMWQAAVMGKAVAANSTIAKNSVNDYLSEVKDIEKKAFHGLTAILGALNSSCNTGSGSFSALYEPFFVADDFRYHEFNPDTEPYNHAGVAWKDLNYTPASATSPWPTHDDLNSNGLGQDYELLESIFATYRPSPAAGKSLGRIAVYLPFNQSFYNNYAASYQSYDSLDNVNIKGTDGTLYPPEQPPDAVGVNTNVFGINAAQLNIDYTGYGNNLDSGVIPIQMLRLTYFVPNGTYTVDPGNRPTLQGCSGGFTFLGQEFPNAGVKVGTGSGTVTNQIIRWSPWDGACWDM